MNTSNIFQLLFPENFSLINITTNYSLPPCAPPKKFSDQKIILISLAYIAAFGGVLANLILLFLFSRKPNREPIMIFLAWFDCFLCFSYITMFGNEALGNYFRIKMAYDALFEYLSTFYFLTRIDQLCIPLMLIASSMQKWAFFSNKKFGNWRYARNYDQWKQQSIFRHLHKPRGQLIIAIVLVSFAVLSTLPKAWAFRVHHFKGCPSYFRSKEIYPTAFFQSAFYETYLLVTTSLQVFGCFFILFFLNAAVVFQLRKKRKQREDLLNQLELLSADDIRNRIDSVLSSVSVNLQRDHRRLSCREQDAVLTLAIIVTSYLICNSLHVALTCIEKWGSSLIYNEEVGWSDFYLISTDLINFLFMLTSAARLLIHLRFNRHIRQKLQPFCPSLSGILSLRGLDSSSRRKTSEHDHPRRKGAFIITEEINL